jgi:hypothetical protein
MQGKKRERSENEKEIKSKMVKIQMNPMLSTAIILLKLILWAINIHFFTFTTEDNAPAGKL